MHLINFYKVSNLIDNNCEWLYIVCPTSALLILTGLLSNPDVDDVQPSGDLVYTIVAVVSYRVLESYDQVPHLRNLTVILLIELKGNTVSAPPIAVL